MTSILMALSVMLPVFLTMAVGIVLRLTGLLPKYLVKDLNRLCFKFLLPLMLFNDIRFTDFSQAFQLKLLLFAAGSMLLLFIVLCWLIPKFVHRPEQQSVVVQGIYRSNYVILGIPIVSNIYQGESIGTITMLVAVIVPLFNFLAVYLFEHFNGEHQQKLSTMVWNIGKNPLIIGAACGIGFAALGITLPAVLDKTIHDIAQITMPLALMILGADLNFHLEKTDARLLLTMITGKLVVVPLMFLPIAIYLGFRGQALASLLAMYASPAAISGYIMAQNANGDHQLAGQHVVITSLLSCVTLFLFIACLHQWGLI